VSRFHLYAMGHWWGICKKQTTTITPYLTSHSDV